MRHDCSGAAGQHGGEGTLVHGLGSGWVSEHAAMNGQEQLSSEEVIDLAH